MTEHQERERESVDAGSPQNEGQDDGAARPEQHAARHEPGGEGERNPQDGTENTLIDTDQHSDAPGPFGTG